MATSFDPGLSTARDRARFRLGDTGALLDAAGAQVYLLQNETIDAMIALNGFSEGVAQLAEGLISRFAQEPDRHEEEIGIRLEWTERIDAWKDLVKSLRKSTVGDSPSGSGGSPFVVGQIASPDTSSLRFGK